MDKSQRVHNRSARHLIVSLSVFLAFPCSVSMAGPAGAPITSSGLNTTVSAPIILPSGQTQYNITGGTRPGGGVNLFHSFGNLNVPNNNIANFLNNSGLATSNILGRVTGGNLSNILGTIQTAGFGNANLFLINPAGFLFGPNATVNVGGMVTFSSADYLKLTDGVRFNAVPKTSVDSLLSAAPVAAFGFLGSNPGAITVQGSHLSVAEGTGISLVGGNITVQAGTLRAPSGQINLVSVNKSSNSKVGGEVVVGDPGQASGFMPTGFKSLGTINLSQGSTVDVSASPNSGHAPGGVSIRGGQFVMNGSSIKAELPQDAGTPSVRGNIEVTAEHIDLSNHSSISTSSFGFGSAGNITFNADTFSASDSAITASVRGSLTGNGGAVTIQGLQGAGSSAHSVSLTNTDISTSSNGLPLFNGQEFFSANGGPIVMRANNIDLTQSGLNTESFENSAGPITLVSTNRIESHDNSLTSWSGFGFGGTIGLSAGRSIDLTNTNIDAFSDNVAGGTITMTSPVISLSNSRLNVWSGVLPGGTISLTGTKAVSLTHGTVLSADNVLTQPSSSNPNGGIIHIDGGAKFTSQDSTISARSVKGNGGSIQVEAHKVTLTDTQLTTSVSGGAQTVGGPITVDGNRVTVKNSEILSTATEGHGGAIEITSHNRHPVINSVIDASSQSGTDGTVTIQRQ